MPSKAALRHAAAMKKAGPDPLSDLVRKPLAAKATAKVQEEESKCTLFDEASVDLIPRFIEKELALGKKLGQGGFCSVFEVTELNLCSESASAAQQSHLSEIKEFHTREYMSKACLRRNSLGKDEARYAIKRLSDRSLADENLFERGVADLAIEAHFLAVIQHRNIIKIRGYALGEFCTDDFFIMMDRLHGTLESAIQAWKQKVKKSSSVLKSMKGGKQELKDLLAERVEYAWEICNAMEFLHSKKIIYRDLKPENIGFDVRGDLKIFDFGLSKEVRNPDADGNYALTGYAGSPIYMAPEVMNCQPYNLSADIFSFAILFWEMLSLSEPYKKVPKNIMEKMVIEKHFRPKCEEKWSEKLTNIIETSWHPLPSKRPTFNAIKNILTEFLQDEGGDGNLDSSIDKSTRSFYNAQQIGKV